MTFRSGLPVGDFTQASPATTWTINHGYGDKGGIALVEVTNVNGEKMMPMGVVHSSDFNTTYVSFSTARSGTARVVGIWGVRPPVPDSPIGDSSDPGFDFPPPPAPNFQVVLRSLSSEMDYWTQYNAFISGTEAGGAFDETFTSANGEAVDKTVTFNSPYSTFSVIGDTALPAGVKIWEYLIDIDPTSISRTVRVGYWTQAFGPPFDQESSNGTFGGYYGSNGDLLGYGNSDTGPTYGAGDVIGVVYDQPNALLYFFKNGTQVGIGLQVVTLGGYVFAVLTS